MSVKLAIDYYIDGFGAFHTNCFDNPVAATSGYYNHLNYYYYCFLNIIMHNWTCKDDNQKFNKDIYKRLFVDGHDDVSDNSIEIQNYILEKMGLEIVYCHVNDKHDFIEKVNEKLTNQIPLILICINEFMYYYKNYLTGNYETHAIIINGRDSEKKIINIQDPLFDRELSLKAFQGEPFYKLNVKESDLEDIWFQSHQYYLTVNSAIYDKELLGIQKTSDSQFRSFRDVFIYFLEHFKKENSYFSMMIENYNVMSDKYRNEFYIYDLRRMMCNGLKLVFNILEKSVLKSTYHEVLCKEINRIKDEHIKYKDSVLNIVHYNALKKKALTETNMSQIKSSVLEHDDQLFMLITKIISGLEC